LISIEKRIARIPMINGNHTRLWVILQGTNHVLMALHQ